MRPLDPRLNAVRDDLADVRLKAEVTRPAYVAPEPYTVAEPVLPCLREPGATARETEFLFGEPVHAFFGRPPRAAPGSDEAVADVGVPESPWWWVQSVADGYVGYVRASGLRSGHHGASHRVSVPRALVFDAPSIRAQLRTGLPLGARLRVTDTVRNGEVFLRLADGGFVLAQHAHEGEPSGGDFVTVAEAFCGAPYLWGGKTWEGLDCSALVQLALQSVGESAPRDSDMQVGLGAPLATDLDGLARGDLVFWKGHVGIMVDASRLLHANGFHMVTVIEPLCEARERLAELGLAITAVRRLSGRLERRKGEA